MYPTISYQGIRTRVYHTLVGTRVYHSRVGTRLYHTLIGTRLYHARVGPRVPQRVCTLLKAALHVFTRGDHGRGKGGWHHCYLQHSIWTSRQIVMVAEYGYTATYDREARAAGTGVTFNKVDGVPEVDLSYHPRLMVYCIVANAGEAGDGLPR